MTLQFLTQMSAVGDLDLVLCLHAKTIAEEVFCVWVERTKAHKHKYIVNFSVVSGGAALLVASQLAGTGILSPTLGLLFGKTLCTRNMKKWFNGRNRSNACWWKHGRPKHVFRYQVYICESFFWFSKMLCNFFWRASVLQNEEWPMLLGCSSKWKCNLSSIMLDVRVCRQLGNII